MEAQGDSIVLEEEIDPNYEPTEKEVQEYASWLGMDLETEQELFWIAREGLKAPLPENWKPCKTTDTEEIYYFNFATGQSTWDHPCDEYYRKVYEDHKKKRSQSGRPAADGDERKKKEKEDVAELLGKKGGKKKTAKAVAKAAAEPLGPPVLARGGSLEKKPLPGLSGGKLGRLSSGGLGSASGLKPVASLGRLKEEAKDDDGEEVLEEDEDDGEHKAPSSALSKPPLGSLLTKKPLPGASGAVKVDSKAEMEGVVIDLEQKKQKLVEEHARIIKELEEEHEKNIAAQLKKSKNELEELEEQDETKIKQRRKELDRKLNDLENQYDKEENNILRERKEKLKRLETDMESMLSHKKQDLERDQQKELQRLESRHQSRLQELRHEQEKEEKLVVRKGEQIREAGELQKDIDKLSIELQSVQDEANALKIKCAALESENVAAVKRADELRIQLEIVTNELQALRVSAAPPTGNEDRKCEDCPQKEKRIQALEETLATEQKNLEASRADVAALKTEAGRLQQEVDRLRSNQSNLEMHTEKNATSERELKALRQAEEELRKGLEEEKVKNAEFARETDEWKRKCTDLENQLREFIENRANEATGAVKADEIEALHNEIADLQDQVTVLSKTNSQIKDQLLKESNEKKWLKEQLDEAIARKEGDADLREAEHANSKRALEALQNQLREESAKSDSHQQQIRELQESARADRAAMEQEKRRLESELSRCTNENARLEAETELLKKQLEERLAQMSEAGAEEEQQANALVTEQKWEIEQLHTQLMVTTREKDELIKRVEHLQNELQALAEAKYQIEAEKEGEILKAKKKDAEKDTISLKVQALQEDLEGQIEKTRVATSEAADLKSQLTKMKFKEQASADRLAQQEDELKVLEARVQDQQSVIERLTRDVRNKSSQLEEKTVSLVEARSENESLSEQIAETKKQLSELRVKMQGFSAHGSQNGGTGELVELRQRLSEQDEKLECLSSEKIQLVEKQRQMTQKLHSLEASLSCVQAERDQVVEECERKDQDLAKWRDRFDKKTKETEQLKVELSQLSSDKEITELALSKEKDEKKDTTNQKAQLEKTKRHMETTIESMTLQLHEVEAAKSRAVLDNQVHQNKLKRLDVELEKLGRDLRVTQEDRDSLCAKMNQQAVDVSALENRIKVLRNENNEQVARAKSFEDDCSRQQEAIKRLEGQLAEKEVRLRKEVEDREAIAKLLVASRSEKDELESELLATKRKAESVEIRYKDQECAASRGDFQLKLRVQQLEAERDGILTAKDRAEQLVRNIEKELQHAKEELKAMKTELETARTRVKGLTLEKEEAQTALLRAQTQAQAHSSFANHLRSGATSADALLVRLQLADVNKAELEQHLADLASQLEVANRRCATADSRCRDHSVEIESLHVEIASLRSAMAKMHLSALETLPLVERLEYEHRKRALKRDWMTQLRDFQEREEHALMRQKARVRAQHEKQVEELADELEGKKQRRIEYEEHLEAQMLAQLRQERDAKVKELRRQIESELLEEERMMNERKERELERVKVEIRRDEEEQRARLREEKQVKREELRINPGTDGHDSPGQIGTGSTLRSTSRRRSHSRSRRGDDDSDRSDADEDPQETQARKPRAHRISKSRSTKSDDCRREIAKWRQRLADETKLLEKAKSLFAEQKKQLKRQAEHVRKDKQAWKQEWAAAGEAGGHKTTILREMRAMIDQNAAAWNASMTQLRERDAWIRRRDAKLRKMRRALDSLRSRRRRSRSRETVRFASDDDDTDRSSMDSDDSDNNLGNTSPSTVLAKLARLDEELLSDASEVCQEGMYASMNEQLNLSAHKYPTTRSLFSEYHVPGSYRLAESVSESQPCSYLSTSAATVRPSTVSSRLYFPSRALPSASGTSRLQGPHYRAMSQSDAAVQRRIARWAHGREAVQQAATRQASWLSSLYEEVKAYGDAKAQSATSAAPVAPLDQGLADDI